MGKSKVHIHVTGDRTYLKFGLILFQILQNHSGMDVAHLWRLNNAKSIKTSNSTTTPLKDNNRKVVFSTNFCCNKIETFVKNDIYFLKVLRKKFLFGVNLHEYSDYFDAYLFTLLLYLNRTNLSITQRQNHQFKYSFIKKNTFFRAIWRPINLLIPW